MKELEKKHELELTCEGSYGVQSSVANNTYKLMIMDRNINAAPHNVSKEARM